jgi:aminotransferase
LELRRAIADYVKDGYGVDYAPESEIIITVGVSEALDLALRAVLNPGDEVLYHEPCYVSYAPIIRFAQGIPVAIETSRENEFRLTREALEAATTLKTRVLLLNFPTNPTGATMSLEDLREIAEFAVKHDLLVITDEIYAELTYEGSHTSIASLPGMKERTIFLNGFSKAWAMTGFRIGFSCAPGDITEAMMKIHQYTMLCAPILAQEAAIEALRNGEQPMREMRDEYRRRRNIMVKSLNKSGIPCISPKGAFYTFPYIGDFGISAHDFAMRLLEAENVACVPGTAFGKCGEGFIRCSYATAMDQIKEALVRIARFVKTL